MNEHIEKKETSILNTNVGDCVKIVAKSSWIKPVSLFFLLVIVFGLGMSMGDGRHDYRSSGFEGQGYRQSGCGMFQGNRINSDYMMGRSQDSFNAGRYGQMSEIRNRMMGQGGVENIDASFDLR